MKVLGQPAGLQVARRQSLLETVPTSREFGEHHAQRVAAIPDGHAGGLEVQDPYVLCAWQGGVTAGSRGGRGQEAHERVEEIKRSVAAGRGRRCIRSGTQPRTEGNQVFPPVTIAFCLSDGQAAAPKVAGYERRSACVSEERRRGPPGPIALPDQRWMGPDGGSGSVVRDRVLVLELVAFTFC